MKALACNFPKIRGSWAAFDRPLRRDRAGLKSSRSSARGVIQTGLPRESPQPSVPLPSPFEELQQQLKKLPGLGYRSAERIALHLLVEHPERLPALVNSLEAAARALRRCPRCGNLTDADLCAVCSDARRNQRLVCVVERVPDLVALERSGAWPGVYHVLHGRLSPMHGVGPEELNCAALFARVEAGEVDEVILSLANDVEGEATCHYVTTHLPAGRPVKVTRIGFGLPSGAGVLYADAVTLKSALEGRRGYG